MGTPADRVPPHLLRHLHLVVQTSLPRQPAPDLNHVTNILSRAPELTQHQATVAWKFLSSPPADGESMLVWQPPQLGTSFASDGYVWADAETAVAHEHNGLALEILIHRSGFRPQQEQAATHSRRRYRLKQNPSLWLVCYYQADQRDFRPARSVQLDQNTRRLLSERVQLERNKSQLVRQEFMLHDTAKFPTVSLPAAGGQAPHPQQNMAYPGNVMTQMSQGQYNSYLQQQQQRAMAAQVAQAGMGPSPSKRPRQNSTTHMAMSATAIPMSHAKPKPAEVPDEVMEEMDSTGADAMDILTPRDIALRRYTQHHEWLEEILSSPFDTHRIIPSELGLGRKGELESLTRDFFDAPVYKKLVGNMLPDPGIVTTKIAESNQPVIQDGPIARVGKLEGNKAKDFATKAADTVAVINDEMETMKRRHAKRMAKLSRGATYKEAEHKVRMSTLGLISGEVDETSPAQAKEIADLQTALEKKEGKSIVSISAVECTEKGGQEEAQQKDNEELQEPQDFDMTGADTFDLDGAQLQTPSESAPSKTAAEPPILEDSAMKASSVQKEPERSSGTQNGQGLVAQPPPETSDDATGEDYVMVGKDDEAPTDAEEPTNPTETSDYPEPLDQNTTEDMPDFGESQQEDFEPNDFGGESVDFGDMDTAGDELSGYAQEIANMSAGAGAQSEADLNSPPKTSTPPKTAAPDESAPSGL